MPATDREVFDAIFADKNTEVEIDMLTYAAYAWESMNGLEIARVAGTSRHKRKSITGFQLLHLTVSTACGPRAAELFDIAARGYLAEAHKKDTEDAIGRSIVSEVKAIVSEVRAASGFGKQLTVALVTAILAPIIIGGIIAGALTWDKFFPTPTEAANTIQSHPPPNPLLPEAPHPPSARNGP